MKTKEEIENTLRAKRDATTEAAAAGYYVIGEVLVCSCCGRKRDISPANEMCFRCHRRGCWIKADGKKVRKCR